MTRFLLIRHAATDALGQHLSGRTPGVLLNAEGQTQAQQLAERLAHLPISALYSSPLERARLTAEPLAQRLGLSPTLCNDFLELDFGQWTNAAFAELGPQRSFQLFNTFRSNTRIPGGELMLEAQTRAIVGLGKLCAQHPNETVAVVSHSDVLKSVVAYYAGMPLDLFQRLEISPASVSVVDVYEETVRILCLNHTGPLAL